MKKADIDAIIIHCSATPEGKDVRAADIEKDHVKNRHFACIGYNYVIDLDGTVEEGRPLTRDGAHCEKPGFSGKPYNKHSIGICYVGGVAKDGKTPKDTRTPAQKQALHQLVNSLVLEYPITEILGHRDASPDLNGDGMISRWEWMKACPSFDVKSEFPITIITPRKK